MNINHMKSPLLLGLRKSLSVMSLSAAIGLSLPVVAASNAPIVIQAEAFAAMSGIQTEVTQDVNGGLNAGWIDAGDWLSYSAVTLPCAGTYTVEYRVASAGSGGALRLEKAGGSPLYGSLSFTGTGGWQTWKTVSQDVVLPAGSVSFGVAATQGGWNINWFRLTPKCGVSSSSVSSNSSTPSSLSSSSKSVSSASSAVSSKLSSSASSLSSVSSSSVQSSSAQSSSSLSSDRNRYDAPRAATAPIIDGVAEALWDQAPWAPIDVFWLGAQVPTAQDFSGRYKAMWDANNLYLLFDITDNVLLDATANPLDRYWDDDSVEIFIDENKNGGNHQHNTSAWAYHIGILGDTVDSTNGTNAKLLNDHVTLRRVTLGGKHLWEMSMRVYGENYLDGTANVPVPLFVGKLMGFSAAYNDNDASAQRESMIGSVDTVGHKNNMGYIDASVFGSMRLMDVNSTSSSSASSSSSSSAPKTVVLQAEDYVRAKDLTAGNAGNAYRQGDVDIEATTDTGGGFNVGWTDAGEWLEFDVSLAAGTYDVTARVASNSGGGFTVAVGDISPLTATVRNTGGWQAWETVNLGSVFVGSTGNRIVRINSNGGYNLNWIQISPNCATDPSCVDTDKDGVKDAQDQCPNTPMGATVDDKGCTLVPTITAKTAIVEMGKGFNLGQLFESTQHPATFETAKAKIDAYYAAGFRNVRIPISWTVDVSGSKLVTDPNVGNVNRLHPRLAVIQQVVDYALSLPGMYVVINAHHEGGIKDGNQWWVLERLWADIADIFRSRSHKLLFEVLNEPHLTNLSAMPADNLRNMVSKARAKIRAVDPERLIVFGGNQWFAANEMAATWPNLDLMGGGQDKFLLATFHHYDPWAAFHSEDTWPKNLNFTDDTVAGPMNTMLSWANTVGGGMPVYIGEWGVSWGKLRPAMTCNNLRLWYQKFGPISSSKGTATAVWDDGGWFKIFDHGTKSFNNNLAICVSGVCNWDTSERFNSGCF